MIIENDFEAKNNKSEFIFSLKLRITNKPFRIIENYYIGVIGNQIHQKLKILPKIFPKKTNLIQKFIYLILNLNGIHIMKKNLQLIILIFT